MSDKRAKHEVTAEIAKHHERELAAEKAQNS
jgi:hypothetical protein